GPWIMVVVPDRGEDLLSRADPSGVAQQVGQQVGLTLWQPHPQLPAARLPAQQVEAYAACLQGRLRGVVSLPEARADAGKQLLEGKRLGDVVGSAEVESLDPVGDLGFCRQ